MNLPAGIFLDDFNVSLSYNSYLFLVLFKFKFAVFETTKCDMNVYSERNVNTGRKAGL